MSPDSANMGAWTWDLGTDTFALSEGVGPVFGLPCGQGPRNPTELLACVHPEDRSMVLQTFAANWQDGARQTIEFRVVWPDQSVHWVEIRTNVMLDRQGWPAQGVSVIIDITRRRIDAHTLHRVCRALRTLTAANEALVRAADERDLLQSVCNVIVDTGGYRMASVGYARDDPGRSIAPMAWAGIENGYLSNGGLHSWAADGAGGQMAIARALRSGEPEFSHDVGADGRYADWRQVLSECNHGSNLALPLLDGRRIFGALSVYAGETEAFGDDETQLFVRLANDLAYGVANLRVRAEHDRIAAEHLRHAEALKKSLEDGLQAIASTLEMRDPYSAGHEKRVAALATAIAAELGLSEEAIHGTHLAATVHDIGKIRIPTDILNKPGKLSDIEFAFIKTHPQAGHDILKDIDFPWPIATIVLQHHERIDGTGYPHGLRGPEILLESRIIAVADTVEAMSSHRPYRPGTGIDPALRALEAGSGTHFDPAVVEACLRLFAEGRFRFSE